MAVITKFGAKMNKFVRLRGRPYIHTCRKHVSIYAEEGTGVYRSYCRRAPIRPIWTSGGAKFVKMRNSLPRTPLNHRAKFDAASFTLAVEIRNHTYEHIHKKTTNKQTINDISTPCSLACVDKNQLKQSIAQCEIFAT